MTITADIKPLDFPAEVVSAFTDGDCWELARTVGLEFGFPVVTANDSDGKSIWYHAGNRLPDGTIVDIEGIWSEATWLSIWAPRVFGTNTPAVLVSQDWSNKDWNAELVKGEFEHEFTESMESMMYAFELIEETYPDAL